MEDKNKIIKRYVSFYEWDDITIHQCVVQLIYNGITVEDMVSYIKENSRRACDLHKILGYYIVYLSGE